MGAEGIILAVVIILILIWLYKPNMLSSVTGKTSKAADPVPAPAPAPVLPDQTVAAPAKVENLVNVNSATSILPPVTSDMLLSMGYTGDIPWQSVIQATEVDPATFASQAEYVRDVRRFSSGANFTAVADDDNNLAFTNFIGLQRPQHVPIGSSARQQPDIDQSVLQRNKQLRF